MTAPKSLSPRPGRRTSRVAFVGEEPAEDDPLLRFAPYVHVAPRRNSITPDRQRAFIAALAATGIVTQAARTIGASLEALYNLRRREGAEGFAAAWEAALDHGIARLEDCALERAIQGEERFIVQNGAVVAAWRRYDTPLLMFLLKQRRRARYDASLGWSQALRPGHPAYERLRREWEEEEALRSAEDSERILASIDAKLDAMRARQIEAEGEAEEGWDVTDD